MNTTSHRYSLETPASPTPEMPVVPPPSETPSNPGPIEIPPSPLNPELPIDLPHDQPTQPVGDPMPGSEPPRPMRV